MGTAAQLTVTGYTVSLGHPAAGRVVFDAVVVDLLDNGVLFIEATGPAVSFAGRLLDTEGLCEALH